MIALFVQTLLLMAVAYFVGAALACLIRRSFFAATTRAVPSERRVDPLPEVAQRTGANRFGRALQGQAQPASAPPARAAAAAAAPEPAQDLKRIYLIDPATEAGLNKLGVNRYEQIAAWMQGDIRRIGAGLGVGDRISRENWIEQAQILAKGGETYYAKRRARGEAASAAPTPDEGEPRSVAAGAANPALTPRPRTGGAAGVVAEVAMAPAAASGAMPAAPLVIPAVQPAPPPAAAMRPAAPATRDNLLRIGGVTAEIEALLAAGGVTRYSQIALWSPVDVARFDQQLGASGRITRENWIEQAQILSRGGDTAFSREYDRRAGIETPAKLGDAPATPPKAASEPIRPAARTDLGALRSVRSEAYQGQNAEPGPAAAQHLVAQNKVLRSAPLNDLKRIRGIGVLIEKKLNSMGVTLYEQIANWRAEDIDRVSQSLDFKGRIERENWVEQARILASGGATEFSRRVDKGEVETSRAKT